jgi:WXXGXW repeat (2 copies)
MRGIHEFILRADNRHAQNEAGEAISMRKPGMWGSVERMGGGAFVGLLLMAVLVLLPARARANDGAQVSVGVSVSFGPPPLPVYAQPMCPGPGYIWTPGYWAYDRDDGYYWVPGTWVMAPFQGALWTPGYWGWDPEVAVFVWHRGYWGPRVGFYGGINYGFGYFGAGYDGGYWRGGIFFYNRAVNRVDGDGFRHVYYRDEFHHEDWDRDRERISFNGGRGGIDARPNRDDFEAERERRMGPNREQDRQERYARSMPQERWSQNHGRPDIAATYRPGRFDGNHVEHATRAGGPYRANQPGDRGRQQGGQWHSFGQQPSGRDQRGQQGYRDTGRQGNQYQQHPDYGRQQVRQQQGQPSGWRQQPQDRNYRGGQQQRQQGQSPNWRQQPPQQQQQRNYRGGQQQQRYQQRPDYRQQARQPQGNWNRQQARPQQGRPQGQRGGNPGRQQARPKGNQGKRDNPHNGRGR